MKVMIMMKKTNKTENIKKCLILIFIIAVVMFVFGCGNKAVDTYKESQQNNNQDNNEEKIYQQNNNDIIIDDNIDDKGDIITFGKYEQDNNLSNGAEDIEWEVIRKKNNKKLLLSKKVLDMKSYSENENSLWSNSDLRYFLNKEFYEKAFSEEEKKKIAITDYKQYFDIENYKTLITYMDIGMDLENCAYDEIVKDKIFILDVEDFVSKKMYPYCEISEYAKSIYDDISFYASQTQLGSTYTHLAKILNTEFLSDAENDKYYNTMSEKIYSQMMMVDIREVHGVRPAMWVYDREISDEEYKKNNEKFDELFNNDYKKYSHEYKEIYLEEDAIFNKTNDEIINENDEESEINDNIENIENLENEDNEYEEVVGEDESADEEYVNTNGYQVVKFGEYYISDKINYKKDPVEWYVLSSDDNKAMLLSKDIVDTEILSYDLEIEDINIINEFWEKVEKKPEEEQDKYADELIKDYNIKNNYDYRNTNINAFINDNFYNNCFANEDKDIIIKNEDGYNVSLLSKKQLYDYHLDKETYGLDFNITNYVASKNKYLLYERNPLGQYYLKDTSKVSIYNDHINMSVFCGDEKFSKGGSIKDAYGISGIRPLIYVDVNKFNNLYENEENNKIVSTKVSWKFEKDDIVKLGKYEQDNNLTNGKEDIEWIILENKNGYCKLLSKNILDVVKYYDDDYAYIDWKNSKVREFANNEFFNEAFDNDIKENILAKKSEYNIKVENFGVSSDIGYEYKNETIDKVSILEEVDIPSFYNKTALYIISNETEYAKKKGLISNTYLIKEILREGNYIYNQGVYSYYNEPTKENQALATRLWTTRSIVGFRPVIYVNASILEKYNIGDGQNNKYDDNVDNQIENTISNIDIEQKYLNKEMFARKKVEFSIDENLISNYEKFYENLKNQLDVVSINEAKVGDVVAFGKEKDDNNKEIGDIYWYVIDKNENELKLLSVFAIWHMNKDSKYRQGTEKFSNLYNNELFNKFFNEKEKKKISSYESHKKNIDKNRYNITNSMALPSASDLFYFFEDTKSCKTYPTYNTYKMYFENKKEDKYFDKNKIKNINDIDTTYVLIKQKVNNNDFQVWKKSKVDCLKNKEERDAFFRPVIYVNVE